jgi:hypothetical protein
MSTKNPRKKSSKTGQKTQSLQINNDKPHEQHAQNKSFTVALMIIVLIIAGFSLFIWFSQPKSTAYNYFDFVQQEDGLWAVTIAHGDELQQIIFHHHPEELDDVLIQKGIDQLVKELALRRAQGSHGQIFVTVDPQAPAHLAIAFVEIVKVTGEIHNLYNIPTKAAYTREFPADDHLPIVNCNDAREDVLVIWIKTEGENVITTINDHCIVLQGSSAQDTVRVADRFVYELLGIMVA